MITTIEIDAFITDTQHRLSTFRQQFLKDQVAPMVGQTMKIERTLKDPISGDHHKAVLDATITGARWGYDDDIFFKVTYVHPYTGKTMETEQGV